MRALLARNGRRTAALLSAICVPCVPLRAQYVPDSAGAAPIVTLALWADEVWLTLLDRDGAFFGRLADEGTLQRFHPRMSSEYELDVWAGRFGLTEDAAWHQAPGGFRAAGTSINHPFIVNVADWRHDVGIAGPVDLTLRYTRAHTLTAQRDYTQVGAAWRGAFGMPWTARVAIGMHFFKASADVEVGLRRAWRANGGAWRADLTLALLDAFNNVIFNALGVSPDDTPAHFDYQTLPVAARASIAYTAPALHVEVHAGSSNRSRVHVTFPATADPAYALTERVSFAGGLVDVRLGGATRAAVYAATAHAATDRSFDTPAPEDLRLRETTTTVGGRAARRWGAAHVVELGLRARWRPERRRSGDGTEIDHRDREVLAHAGVAREPVVGWRWRLAYALTDRTAGPLAPQLTAVDQRALTEGGYRFATGFALIAGLRWRVHRLTTSPFAGGHLRFAAGW